MNRQVLAAALFGSLLAMPLAAIAGGGYAGTSQPLLKSDWDSTAYYEPCMNGDVSSTGNFRSQLEENKAAARMMLIAVPEA